MSHCECKVTCSCERQNEIYKKSFPESKSILDSENWFIAMAALALVSLLVFGIGITTTHSTLALMCFGIPSLIGVFVSATYMLLSSRHNT